MVANGTLVKQESQGELLAAHPALSGGGAAMQVRGQYTTAVSVQRPRSLQNVEHKLMEEASVAGSSFYYAWGAGKDRIEGPSFNLAMSAVRLWGNCAVELQPVQETRDAWIFTAAFVDLETGFTISRQFRQSKNWTVYGKFDEARKDDIRFQIGQSKAIRNVVLNAVPTWLTNKAIERAKEGVRELLEKAIDAKGIEFVRDKLIERLGGVGVTHDMILAKFGRPTKGGLTLEDMVAMRGDHEALSSGADTVDHLYLTVPVDEPEKPAASKSDGLADKLESKKPAPKQEAEPPAETKPAEEPAPVESDEPPFEPQSEADQFEIRIGDAESEMALRAVQAEIKSALRGKKVTAQRSGELAKLIDARRKQLEAEGSQDGPAAEDPFYGR